MVIIKKEGHYWVQWPFPLSAQGNIQIIILYLKFKKKKKKKKRKKWAAWFFTLKSYYTWRLNGYVPVGIHVPIYVGSVIWRWFNLDEVESNWLNVTIESIQQLASSLALTWQSSCFTLTLVVVLCEWNWEFWNDFNGCLLAYWCKMPSVNWIIDQLSNEKEPPVVS